MVPIISKCASSSVPSEAPKLPRRVLDADGMQVCGDLTNGGTEVSKWRFVFSGKMDKRKCVICDEKIMVQLDASSGRVFDVRVVMNF